MFNAHNEKDEAAIESLVETVLDTAMESAANKKIIDEKTRDSLPDSAFGVIYITADGEKLRKYPLIVKNDYEATKELLHRAIEYFPFCKPEWKKPLANNILRVLVDEDIVIKVHPRNILNKYIKLPEKFIDVDTNNDYHISKEK